MKITIKDVAREAGVSISTVSKVINDAPTISDATKIRVKEIMEELHYQPNSQASNFARQKTNNIIFLTKLEPRIAFSNPHMFEIMCGVQTKLGAKSYNMSFTGARSKEEALSIAQDAIARKRADGIVVHGSATSKELAELLVNEAFPHILIGKPRFRSPVCWIDINNCISGEMAATHLAEYGYTRIAFVGGRKEDEISTDRLLGFTSAMRENGLSVPEHFIKHGTYTKESGYQLTMELLDAPDKPEAIICENDKIAYGVMQALDERKFRIPGQMSVISFDDFPLSHMIEPPMTVVDIDVYDMGIQAGRLLLQKIRHPLLQVQYYTTLPKLVVRETTCRKKTF